MIAYAPFLTLLLPIRMAALAGAARVEWLGTATLAGAAAAGLSNIAAGWASDVAKTRRFWMGLGLCLTVASYAPLHLADTPAGLVAAVVAYQVALNLLLAPMTAWAADAVPPERRGLLGGLLGAGPPAAALAGPVVMLPALELWMRPVMLCSAIVALTSPLILSERTAAPPAVPEHERVGAGNRTDFLLLWSARLLVQVAGSILFGFLLYYLQGLPDAPSPVEVAALSAAAFFLAFPISLAIGRYSDRLRRRKPVLAIAALLAAAGLAVMAVEIRTAVAALGYALFGCASTVFLALHSGVAIGYLPSPARRGRDLGVLNLANTLPAMLAPALAIGLVPGRGFAPLLALATGLVVIAAICVLLVRETPEAT